MPCLGVIEGWLVIRGIMYHAGTVVKVLFSTSIGGV